MTIKMQRYAEAKMADIVRVLDAAERLYAIVAEFPDDPECWADDMAYLDTPAYNFQQQRTKGSGNA